MTETLTKALQRNPVTPLQESTRQLVEDTGLYVKDQVDTGIETAGILRNKIADSIKERPLITVLVALGIGVALGTLARK